MNALDWAIVAVLAISVVAAAAHGFFFEMFSLGGAVFGYILAAWEYWRLVPVIEPYVKSAAIAKAAAFLAIFFAVVMIAGMAGKITQWALEKVGMRWVDRLLGAAFGLVRGIVIATAAVMALATFTPESRMLEGSETARYFLLTAKGASWLAPEDVKLKFNEGLALVRRNRMEAQPQPAAKPNGAAKDSAVRK